MKAHWVHEELSGNCTLFHAFWWNSLVNSWGIHQLGSRKWCNSMNPRIPGSPIKSQCFSPGIPCEPLYKTGNSFGKVPKAGILWARVSYNPRLAVIPAFDTFPGSGEESKLGSWKVEESMNPVIFSTWDRPVVRILAPPPCRRPAGRTDVWRWWVRWVPRDPWSPREVPGWVFPIPVLTIPVYGFLDVPLS